MGTVLGCVCGHSISDTVYPDSYGGNLVTQLEADNFVSGDSLYIAELIHGSRQVYECSHCRRLWIWAKQHNRFISYRPEDLTLEMEG